ncbi:MBL fold metallo-hydrolase [Yoonia sp. 2307UL14-13]|uniref:MBL fold metallo-hydrolase n=1 Tax=Yoonia sp. 2307UL14-13 TaxID=3126506 RepID=UPI0030994D8A
MIRPVFANTAWITTRRGLILRGGGMARVRLKVRVGLIEHPRWGPVLIDAGYGPQVSQAPGRSLALRIYARLLRFKINPLESPLALLADHGYLPDDVRVVLLTHLHADHIAYLNDLPNATFVIHDHVHGDLRQGVFNELLPADFAGRCRMLQEHPTQILPFDLGEGFDVLGDGSVLGVPLPGHAPGHYGLCFPGGRPLLYGADLQWLCAAVIEGRTPGFPASWIGEGRARTAESVDFAQRFVRGGGDLVLCHDPTPTAYDWAPRYV